MGARLNGHPGTAEMSNPTRRRVLQGTALAALPLRAWGQAPALTFLAVGDWGRDGAFGQTQVAERMGESGAAIGARFIVSVGDNFYEDGVTGVDDPIWRTSFEEVYTAPALQAPWYVALGNHDYHGDTQAQIDYSRKSPRWRLPHRWYSFKELAPDGASIEFFVLDTSPFSANTMRTAGPR